MILILILVLLKKDWYTAKKCFTKEDDGLVQDWKGFVFLNPPYSNPTIKLFMGKLSEHNNGIALIYARVGNTMFHEFVWNKASSIYFLRKRIKFIDEHGKEGGSPGTDSCFVAYGSKADNILKNLSLSGKYIKLNQ
jgi:hypothetical protein|nr:MAG TPA: DNA N-6-adenine-methyltransferase [Caudoviricetes sp.]